jgi:hypothetical protein
MILIVKKKSHKNWPLKTCIRGAQNELTTLRGLPSNRFHLRDLAGFPLKTVNPCFSITISTHVHNATIIQITSQNKTIIQIIKSIVQSE